MILSKGKMTVSVLILLALAIALILIVLECMGRRGIARGLSPVGL